MSVAEVSQIVRPIQPTPRGEADAATLSPISRDRMGVAASQVVIPPGTTIVAKSESRQSLMISSGGASKHRDECSVEEELAKHKYSILKRIFVAAEGAVIARYIKAYNQDGNVVYIDPDVEGQILRAEEDKIFFESRRSAPIPDSYKYGTAQCVENEAVGILFECNGVYCTVRPHEETSQKYHEHIYCEKEARETELIFEESHLTAYPIVRYSEIVSEHCDLVRENIKRVSARVFEVIYSLARKSLECGQKEVSELVCYWNQFVESHQKYLEHHDNVMKALIANKCQFECMPCLDACQEDCYRRLIFNIYSRKHNLQRVTKKMLKVGAMLSALHPIGEEIRDYNCEIGKFISHIETDHTKSLC